MLNDKILEYCKMKNADRSLIIKMNNIVFSMYFNFNYRITYKHIPLIFSIVKVNQFLKNEYIQTIIVSSLISVLKKLDKEG